MDPEIKKIADQLRERSAELTSNFKRLQELAHQETAKETRFVKGAMISLMGDGSVRVKFENKEEQEKFYKTVLNE